MKRLSLLVILVTTVVVIQCGHESHNKFKQPPTDSSKPVVVHDTIVPVVKTEPDSFYHIYLTIDDGPDAGSRYINQAALSDSAKITVLLVGSQVYKSDSLARLYREFQSNPFVEIGSHSYSHAALHYKRYYKRPPTVIEDFRLNADTLHLKNKIVRLPGRNTWRINGRSRSDLPDDSVEANSLAAEGYSVFGWDIEWRHVPENGSHLQAADNIARQIANKFKENKTFTPRHVVILAHDSSFLDPYNQKQLAWLIHYLLKRQNYRLDFLSSYP